MPWIGNTQGHYICTTVLIRVDVSKETTYLVPARANWNPLSAQACLNWKQRHSSNWFLEIKVERRSPKVTEYNFWGHLTVKVAFRCSSDSAILEVERRTTSPVLVSAAVSCTEGFFLLYLQKGFSPYFIWFSPSLSLFLSLSHLF